MSRLLLTAALCAVLASGPSAQSRFATSVVSFQQGAGGGLFDTSKILGGPEGGGLGAGSLEVLTLGEGGSVTLGFDVVIVDGPGADFSVFENGFVVGGAAVFAEVAFVEVSSNGTDFARFPSSYGPPGGLGGSDMGSFAGMSGGLPVLADVTVDPDSPFDPVSSGGEAFDLAELSGHPLVLGGLVDLDDIRFVRLVDVLFDEQDDQGVIIAPGSQGGGSDFDAVAVLHHASGPATPPVCDLSIDAQGHLRMSLGDPDFFFDLDPAELRLSVNLTELPIDRLLRFMAIISFDDKVAELRSFFPVQGQGLTFALAVSAADQAGDRSGDQVMVQDL